jgi:hypothetical protein
LFQSMEVALTIASKIAFSKVIPESNQKFYFELFLENKAAVAKIAKTINPGY